MALNVKEALLAREGAWQVADECFRFLIHSFLAFVLVAMVKSPKRESAKASASVDIAEARTSVSDEKNHDRADDVESPTTSVGQHGEYPRSAESPKVEEIRVLYPKRSGRRRRRQKKGRGAAANLTSTIQSKSGASSAQRAADEEAAAEKNDRNPLYVDLHVAIRDHDTATVAAVVAKITNVNVPTLPDYQSPAHVAASTGQVDVLQVCHVYDVQHAGKPPCHSLAIKFATLISPLDLVQPSVFRTRPSNSRSWADAVVVGSFQWACWCSGAVVGE